MRPAVALVGGQRAHWIAGSHDVAAPHLGHYRHVGGAQLPVNDAHHGRSGDTPGEGDPTRSGGEHVLADRCRQIHPPVAGVPALLWWGELPQYWSLAA